MPADIPPGISVSDGGEHIQQLDYLPAGNPTASSSPLVKLPIETPPTDRTRFTTSKSYQSDRRSITVCRTWPTTSKNVESYIEGYLSIAPSAGESRERGRKDVEYSMMRFQEESQQYYPWDAVAEVLWIIEFINCVRKVRLSLSCNIIEWRVRKWGWRQEWR